MQAGKIAIIGAGSIVFCSTILNDILSTPCLNGFEIALMSPTYHKIERMKNYADKIIAKNNLKTTVCITTDRQKALKDAGYIILMFQIGGVEAYGCDYEIPLKYGVDQCIGDSMGPGGVFRLLRTVPVMRGIDEDIKKLCPGAFVLNYVNPMGAVCTYLGRYTSMTAVGLCHGVQTTLDLIAGYTDVPKTEIDFVAAGINHMAWFLKLEHHGENLYPLLRERFELPEYYMNEKVRGEVMRHCGYFMTESTGHLSEYLPWFRKNKKALGLYCDMPDFGGASGASYHFSKMIQEKYNKNDVFALESGHLEPRSKEYCSYIIEALETGEAFKFNGNILNDGYIKNLPDHVCVEIPVYADKQGMHPVTIGDLPAPLAAMNQSNISLQSLAAQAAYKADPELVFWAIAMDPLTSSVLTLKEIRDMTIEMFEAQKAWLPDFDHKRLQKLDSIFIPAGTKAAEVPLDPALAINSRFGKL